MDEPPLPADIERWPRDPFALLGVKMGSDVKTVKRAYQRLIRFYRPEHYPVEFRRIRESYESAQSMTGWFSTIDPEMVDEIVSRGSEGTKPTYDDQPPIPLAPDPQPIDSSASESPATESSGTGTNEIEPNAGSADVADEDTQPPSFAPDLAPSNSAEHAGTERRRPTAEDRPPSADDAPSGPVDLDEYGERPYAACLAEAWRPALAGDSAAAYAELMKLYRDRPGRPEAYLALYWLLRTDAQLDSERKPCDWLAECIAATDASDAALELYRREIVRRPAEALSPRCTGLVRSANARAVVAALVEWRWRAALATQREAAAIVREDLDSLRKTRLSYDSNAWLRVLWAVVETCCWTRSPEAQRLTTDAMRELERFANAPDANHDALSQLDYMTEAATTLNAVSGGDSVQLFRRLIARSWSLSASDLYVSLTRLVEPYLPHPDELLEFLSQIANRGALILGRYGQVLQMVQHELGRNLESFWTPSTAENVILDFLVANQVKIRYDDDLRKKLLQFCLYERMSPEMVAESINAGYEFKESVRWLPERIMQDWALRFAYSTMHLMTA